MSSDATSTSPPPRLVIGISGASGAPYAVRTIELAAAAGAEVHVAISPWGRRLLADELDIRRPDPDALSAGLGERVTIHPDNDLGAAIASGSFLHAGMIVVPCSANTLGALASGTATTLLQRAAAVTLKERRRLVLAYRESPASPIDLRNMTTLSDAGAIIAPASPGFYLRPATIDDLVDFVAARLLDLLDVRHGLDVRWDAHLERLRAARARRRQAAGSTAPADDSSEPASAGPSS